LGSSARLAGLGRQPLLVVDAEKPEQLRALGAALGQVSAAQCRLPGPGGGRWRWRLLLQSAGQPAEWLGKPAPQRWKPEALAQLCAALDVQPGADA